MITLIDGKPGGGKSYYIVRHIALNVDNYSKIFTNISGFKFEKFSNVSLFKQSSFEKLMDDAKDIFDAEDSTDEDILAFLLEREFLSSPIDGKYKPVLICYDEVHNILGGRDTELWLWILTYHRHLYIDFIFATQDSGLVNLKYSKTFQKIYRALSADRNVFAVGKVRSNRYQEHLKLPIIDGKNGTFLQNIYIKREQQYYDLYEAGDEVRSKSVFSGFIFKAVGFIILAVVGFFVFLTYFAGGFAEDVVEKSDVEVTKVRKKHTKHRSSKLDYDGLQYLKMSCFSKQCSNSKLQINLEKTNFLKLVSETKSKILGRREYSKVFVIYDLLVSYEFISLFKEHRDESVGFKILN